MHDGGGGHHGGGHHGGHHSPDGGQSFVSPTAFTGSRASNARGLGNGWYARWRLPLLLVAIAAGVVIALVSAH